MVYKFFDFPDYPTATVHDSCDPHFNDLKSYSVLMDLDLDQYLKSVVIQFYVFDYKEEQMDLYLGKARIQLLSLAQDKGITGEGYLDLYSVRVMIGSLQVRETDLIKTLQASIRLL